MKGKKLSEPRRYFVSPSNMMDTNNASQADVEIVSYKAYKTLESRIEELEEDLLTKEEKLELMDYLAGTDLYQIVDLLRVKPPRK